ncbi:MAG: hypothetical protein WCP06_05970 [Verrucomicrobiota bacterium]
MKAKIQLASALTIACLASGCVVPGPYYAGPIEGGPIEYGAPVEVVPEYPGEIVVPEVVIIENGVRHDRYFYERHPEYYHRDRMRYPARFAPRYSDHHNHDRDRYSGHSDQRPSGHDRNWGSHAVVERPSEPTRSSHAPAEDAKAKKKHHGDSDRDH